MFTVSSCQNPINERHVYKNNYSLAYVFHFFFWYRVFISFVSNVVIIYWHVLYLLDFDTADMISFDIKYILLSKTISLKTTLLMTCFVANGKNLKYSKVLLYIYLFIYL